MQLKQRLAKMYEKGYRFCIVFDPDSKIEPLATKTMTEIGPLMRKDWPNEKNWRAYEFDANGNEVKK